MKIDLLKIKSALADFFSRSTKSLLSKMIAAFLILILMPVSTIGIITTNKATNDLLDQMEESISTSTLQTSNCLDLFFEKAESISLQLYSNPATLEYSITEDCGEQGRFVP